MHGSSGAGELQLSYVSERQKPTHKAIRMFSTESITVQWLLKTVVELICACGIYILYCPRTHTVYAAELTGIDEVLGQV
jgi:hypothetical protein